MEYWFFEYASNLACSIREKSKQLGRSVLSKVAEHSKKEQHFMNDVRHGIMQVGLEREKQITEVFLSIYGHVFIFNIEFLCRLVQP